MYYDDSAVENAAINAQITEPIQLSNGHDINCDCSECDAHHQLWFEHTNPTCGGCGCQESACECNSMEDLWDEHIADLKHDYVVRAFSNNPNWDTRVHAKRVEYSYFKAWAIRRLEEACDTKFITEPKIEIQF